MNGFNLEDAILSRVGIDRKEDDVIRTEISYGYMQIWFRNGITFEEKLTDEESEEYMRITREW